MPKVTKRFFDQLRPFAGKDVVVWDSELRGFGVQVKPTGSGSFILQYRNAEGRSRRLTLGAVGVFTPEVVRKLARSKLGDVARGADPADEKQAARSAPTVAEICDWYLEKAEGGELLGQRRRPIARTTPALDRSRINTHVRPLLGNRIARQADLRDVCEGSGQVRSPTAAAG